MVLTCLLNLILQRRTGFPQPPNRGAKPFPELIANDRDRNTPAIQDARSTLALQTFETDVMVKSMFLKLAFLSPHFAIPRTENICDRKHKMLLLQMQMEVFPPSLSPGWAIPSLTFRKQPVACGATEHA